MVIKRGSDTKALTLRLNEDVLNAFDDLCSEFSLTRSSLVGQLLIDSREKLEVIRKIFKIVEKDDTAILEFSDKRLGKLQKEDGVKKEEREFVRLSEEFIITKESDDEFELQSKSIIKYKREKENKIQSSKTKIYTKAQLMEFLFSRSLNELKNAELS